jgi:Uma2 family endonuclease
MSAARQEFRMSVEEYLALDNASPNTRYEYLDGRVLMMSGGSTQHSFISANIISFFIQALRGSTCKIFTSDARVRLNETQYVYPDATISCSDRPLVNSQTIAEPAIIFEVLSPGTEAYERGNKLRSYRACPSLQTVLLISQDQPVVDVVQRQSTGIWTIDTYLLGDQIILDTVGVTLPVEEIYREVEFPTPSEETSEPQL